MEKISHDRLEKIIPCYEQNLDDYIYALDIEDYKNKNPSLELLFSKYGNVSIYNQYMSKGNLKNEYRKEINLQKYINKYPFLSLELMNGEYTDAYDHYIKKGQYMGLEI